MTNLVSLIPTTSPVLLAASLTNAERRPLPAHLIKDVTDPWRCPAELLGYLAYAHSVDIWKEDWPEQKKRQVIANSFKLHRSKTTIAGIRAHLALVDARLLHVVRPPASGFYFPAVTDEARREWLARLPQIRIRPFTVRSDARGRYFFKGPYGFCHYGHAFQRNNRGSEIYGRKASLYDQGQEAPIKLERFAPLGADPYEQIYITGKAPARRFWAYGFFSVIARKCRADENVLTVRLQGEGFVKSISATTRPVDVRPERIAEQRQAPQGRAFFGRRSHRFMKLSDAALFIYDRIALNDASRLGVRRKAKTFWSHSRYGIDPHTAELTVSVPMKRSRRAYGRFLTGFWKAANFDALAETLSAVRVSKSFRDTIFIDTTTSRPVTLRDGLSLGNFKLGERIQKV